MFGFTHVPVVILLLSAAPPAAVVVTVVGAVAVAVLAQEWPV